MSETICKGRLKDDGVSHFLGSLFLDSALF